MKSITTILIIIYLNILLGFINAAKNLKTDTKSLSAVNTATAKKQVVNPETRLLSKPVLTKVSKTLEEADVFSPDDLKNKSKNYYTDSLGPDKVYFPNKLNQVNTTNYIKPEIIPPKNNTKVPVEVTYGPPKQIILEPVSYVPDLSPGGRAALELANSHDYEYEKLLNAGFETPKTITNIIEDLPTNVNRAAEGGYLWRGINPFDKNLWQNVEYNRYQNEMLETSRYSTPAKFTKNEFGNIVVHAPSNSNLQISTPASKTLTSMPNQMNFLDIKDKEYFQEDIKLGEDHLDNMIDTDSDEFYSFLN